MCDLINLTQLAEISATEDDNDVVPTMPRPRRGDIASILIVEHDEDCADALDAILSDLPGITSVQTVGTARDAVSLLDDGEYDVTGFAMTQTTLAPDVIFIGAHQPDTSGDVALELSQALAAFRARVPDALIVLLCVYPLQYCDALSGTVDACIRKDTSARELRELIDALRASRQRA